MTLVPGSEFGGYRIEAELGRGGQAVVYRAAQVSLGREVALKVFEAGLSRTGAGGERFRREALASGRLDHPRIVTVYDAGQVDDRPYIAMKLVKGRTLADRLAVEGPLPAGEALRIIDDVSDALDFAHRSGLLHRDVKSANVLLDREGNAYLSDFGLARLDDLPGMTRRGDWLGTPEYAAPEQVEGKRVSAASDIYGLAVIAFECLTGRPPFVHAESSAILLAHVRDQPPLPSSLNANLGPRADAVIMDGLAKEPSHRPMSARAFAADLRAALEGGAAAAPTLVGPAPTVLASGDPWQAAMARFSAEGAAAPARPAEPAPADEPETSGTGRRFAGSVLVGAASIILLAVAAAGVGGWFAGQSAAPDADAARSEGYEAGRRDGVEAGTQRGLSTGRREGRIEGVNAGREEGYRDGRRDGLRDGRAQGRNEGYLDGFDEGRGSVFSGLESGPPGGGSYYVFKMSADGLGVDAWFSDPLTFGECVMLNANGTIRRQIRTSDPYAPC